MSIKTLIIVGVTYATMAVSAYQESKPKDRPDSIRANEVIWQFQHIAERSKK